MEDVISFPTEKLSGKKSETEQKSSASNNAGAIAVAISKVTYHVILLKCIYINFKISLLKTC